MEEYDTVIEYGYNMQTGGKNRKATRIRIYDLFIEYTGTFRSKLVYIVDS